MLRLQLLLLLLLLFEMLVCSLVHRAQADNGTLATTPISRLFNFAAGEKSTGPFSPLSASDATGVQWGRAVADTSQVPEAK